MWPWLGPADWPLTTIVPHVHAARSLPVARCPLPPFPADLQWVVQAGWADAAAHETGKAYAQRLRSVLGPLSTSMGRYVNLLDVAEGVCCCCCCCCCCCGGGGGDPSHE